MKKAHIQKMFKSEIITAVLICLFLPAVLVKGDWESDANARIEQIRKRDIKITLVNSLGNPVQDINVAIEQVSHRFAFGTCIKYSKMSDNIYKNFILNHFEWAVCENETKWPSNESTRDVVTYTQADIIYTWCNNNGIKMRGHTLFWEQLSNVQTWVQNLPYATYPTPSQLLEEVDERIDGAVAHFRNKFYNWDVDNEMLSDSFYNRLGDAGRVHMFQRANSVDPNCKLFMNEYSGNSFGGYNSAPYAARANNLISMGAPIHGLGIQAHLAEDVTFNPQSYYTNVLQPLAGLNKPIWATEFDASHTNVTTSADNIENFSRICFSHSSVEGIIMWGFMEGQMWRPNAALVTAAGTLTARGVRYESLMNEWTTSGESSTNTSGAVNFRGFHGNYDVTLYAYGQTPEIHTIELVPGTGTEEFVLLTNLHTPVPDVTAPEPNPMEWVSLPAATGAHTITMTASAVTDDSPPVYYYFECTNEPNKSSSWQTSPTFTARNLQPLTEYSFRVRAKDSYTTQNTTEWSSIESATTFSLPTEINLLGSWVAGLNHAKELGTDRALIFIAHGEFAGTVIITSVTYSGQEMIKIMEASSETTTKAYTAAFILPEYGVATASDSNFVVTWSSAPNYALYSSAFFSGADQTNSIGATAYSWTTDQSVSTSPLETNNNNIVILGATHGSSGSYEIQNDFIEGIDQATSSQLTGVTGYKAAIGVDETPSVTFTGSTSRQTIIGFVLQAPAYIDAPPAAPAGLAVTAGNETVALEWDDNTEPDLAGYNVYRSTTSGSGYGQINISLVTDSNYIDDDANNGTPYYYVVTAIDNGSNESGNSNEASATPDFQNCADVQNGGFGFVGDINNDCYVDMNDLAVIVQYWLNTDCAASGDCEGADLEPDGDVDFIDYNYFADEWLNCNDPIDLECVHNW